MVSLLAACSFHCNVVIRRRCQDLQHCIHRFIPHSDPTLLRSVPLTPTTSSYLTYKAPPVTGDVLEVLTIFTKRLLRNMQKPRLKEVFRFLKKKQQYPSERFIFNKPTRFKIYLSPATDTFLYFTLSF